MRHLTVRRYRLRHVQRARHVRLALAYVAEHFVEEVLVGLAKLHRHQGVHDRIETTVHHNNTNDHKIQKFKYYLINRMTTQM